MLMWVAFLPRGEEFFRSDQISLKLPRVKASLSLIWVWNWSLRFAFRMNLTELVIQKRIGILLNAFLGEVDASFTDFRFWSQILGCLLGACFSRLLKVLSILIEQVFHSGKVPTYLSTYGRVLALSFCNWRFPQPLQKSSDGVILIIEEFIDHFKLDVSHSFRVDSPYP